MVPIVVLYILRLRLRRQPVSTLLFWNQIFEEKRPRSIWQQLRHLLSLLMQLAFLALLVAALIDPFWSWERLQARRIVLVIDNSASMNAAHGTGSRLDEAKRQARNLISGLRLRDQMAIVSASSAARVEVGLTGHQKTLRTALQSIQPTDGPTRANQAIQLGRRLLAEHENAQVIVLSDGCFSTAENQSLQQQNDVQLMLVGQSSDNLAITNYQVRRSLNDPIGYQVLVEVSNYSEQALSCQLELTLGADRQIVDVIPLSLEPDEVWRTTIDHTSAEGGILRATLDHADALPVDNQAVALLPERKPIPVILVTAGSLFLQRVFEAIPLVQLTMTQTIPERVARNAILVLHEKVPDKLPGGRVLVIGPNRSCDLWEVSEPLETPIVTHQNSDSPLMTHVSLDNVLMPQARAMQWKIDTTTLLSSLDETPLYVAAEPPGGKLLGLNVELAQGDLPLRIAFPVMMTNAINWFLGNEGRLREAVASGELVEVDLAPLMQKEDSVTDSVDREQDSALIASEDASTQLPGDRQLVLRSPLRDIRPLPPGVQQTTVGPLDQCGVWTILDQTDQQEDAASAADQPGGLQLACNLANSQESDLRPIQASSQGTRAGVPGVGGRPIWFYLIVLAFVLITVEWYLYQRRWIA